ncbi:MAG: hypothetical protein JSU94_05835 [Phycisphaerales bacterium]|nr:MAG: hypothetical protein JSU94_05835 [Phycisphaerales bacterium]
MANRLIACAERKFNILDHGDREFFRAVAEGRPAELGAKAQEDKDPGDDHSWGSERVLKADRIAWLCTNPETMAIVPRQGIEIRGARIEGDLDLRFATVPFPLVFSKCTFIGKVDLRNSRLCALDLSGSQTHCINLTGSDVQHGVFLRNGFKSDGILCLSGATIKGSLDCTNAHLANGARPVLDADGLKVTHNVLLHNGFKAEGMVSLAGAEIGGNLECNQGVFENKGNEGHVALNAERLNVGGDVFLCEGFWGEGKEIGAAGFRAEGEVKLARAEVRGTLECRGGQFINPGGPALKARGITVGGDVLFHDGFRSEGEVSILGAEIGGNLECNQGVFLNKDGVALDAENLRVNGHVFMCKDYWGADGEVVAKPFTAQGEVKLVDACIGGTVECKGGLFINPDGPAIAARGVVVAGSVLLHNGFVAKGEVDLVSGKIGGNLECTKGVFVNPSGISLDAERLQVGGDVFLCGKAWGAGKELQAEGFKSRGEVILVRADIGGDLDCEGGKFINHGGCALKGNGIRVKGSVLLRHGVKVNGELHLVGAVIGGDLKCEGGEFANEGKLAIDAQRIDVKGDVCMCRGTWVNEETTCEAGFNVIGQVRLVGAAVGGTLDFKGASFTGGVSRSGDANISLVGATIKREVVWRGIVAPEEVTLDLRFVRAVKLSDDRKSWPSKDKGRLLLEGLVYDEITWDIAADSQASPDRTRLQSLMDRWKALALRFSREAEAERAREDIKPRIDWLGLQGGEFHHQPYEQLVSVLRRNGRENDAKEVLIAKARDRAKLTNMPHFGRYWHSFLGFVIGYGYRPWRALKISLLVIALGSILFQVGYSKGVVRPTREAEYVSVTEGEIPNSPLKRPRIGEDYPTFNAMMYSIDMFVPMVDLRQAKYWLPTVPAGKEAPESGIMNLNRSSLPVGVVVLRVYMWGHIISGWILTTLLFAGLTGLVKR